MRRIEKWAAANCEDIYSVSGGKDSTAAYLLGVDSGRPFRAVFADTGNEHSLTYEFINRLAERTGGPEIETVRADFSGKFAKRRAYIAEHWPQPDKDGNKGVEPAIVARAIAAMHSTGNPFLDLCLLKGRFPSRRAQFCTAELKVIPIESQILIPASQRARDSEKFVRSIVAVRAEEGGARRHLGAYAWSDWQILKYRPIIHWTVEQVFAIHRRHGIEPNPLYKLGMKRVGCMPCINCAKPEVREIAARFPEEIERIAEWERIVGAASKRGASTFFTAKQSSPALKNNKSIHDHVDYARTSHGGFQFDLEHFMEPAACSSAYGLCE